MRRSIFLTNKTCLTQAINLSKNYKALNYFSTNVANKKTVKNVLSDQLRSIISNHFSQSGILSNEIAVELSSHQYYDTIKRRNIQVDYQSSIALRIAKVLKLNPVVIADNIITYLQISSVYEVSNTKGFINFTLLPSYICDSIRSVVAGGDRNRLNIRRVDRPCRVVFDFSSPNVAKEMHVVCTYVVIHIFFELF